MTATTNPIVSGGSNFLSGDSAALSGSLRRSSIMWLGDSLTSYGAGLRSFLIPDAAIVNTPSATYTTLNASGIFVRNTQFDMRYTPAGAGALKYYTADTTMTWTSNGDTEGTRVSVATGGHFYLPSGTDGQGGAYVQLTITNKPAGNASDAITPATSNSVNTSAYLNGFSGAWEVYNGNPFDVTYNISVSGCTSADILLWQSQWNTLFTDVTVIEVGTNDTSTIANNPVILANIQNIVQQRQLIGSIPIVMGLFPNATGSLTDKRADMDLNQQLQIWCRAEGVRYCDTYQLLSDWTTQNPGVRTNCFGSDNLHTTALGAYLVQKYALGPLLNPLVYELSQLSPSASSTYSSTLAPRANLLSGGGLIGTAGTTGTGASGTVPTNWTTSRTAGSTATVVSTAPASGGQARTDGLSEPWWKLVIDNSGGAANEVIAAFGSAFISGSNYAAGDQLVFSGELSLVTTGMMRFEVVILGTNFLQQVVGATTTFEMYNQYGNTEQFKFRSRPLTIPAGGIANMNCRIAFYMQAASTATALIGPLSLCKVI